MEATKERPKLFGRTPFARLLFNLRVKEVQLKLLPISNRNIEQLHLCNISQAVLRACGFSPYSVDYIGTTVLGPAQLRSGLSPKPSEACAVLTTRVLEITLDRRPSLPLSLSCSKGSCDEIGAVFD
ncbi:hypothetical protein PGT21_035144 [Puccinia graminis f. sp. tritici]|uniref:Uncharacterized protein n=1 Tax=Puccinia graminis f. sp. tritici TaxID=56615 RepID=A0A5B0QPS3_PUCGR|nr:hypothetical protein PGT21_035144 [Puccinia graminis f. sp. tritici]